MPPVTTRSVDLSNDPKIFDFSDPVEFLNASLTAIQLRNPSYSLRAWAKQLGLTHVAMLSMVLNRKRRLLPTLSTLISRQYRESGRFTDIEARYFDMLVLHACAVTPEEKIFYEKILADLRPDKTFATLSLDHFRVVSEWYHFAILEMTQLKAFKPDLRWISLRLGDSVNQSQVQEAIERLIRVGLLERTPEGGLRKLVGQYATPTDVSNEAIRKYHTQMIQKAMHALETQSIERRDVSGHIMTVSRDKLPEAKRMIRDFRRKLAEFLETPDGDAVYHVNVQLFDVLHSKEAGDSHV